MINNCDHVIERILSQENICEDETFLNACLHLTAEFVSRERELEAVEAALVTPAIGSLPDHQLCVWAYHRFCLSRPATFPECPSTP
jgi:hypothetical protein